MAEATTLQGRYRLNHWLAAGAMGTVYEATDERLNRHVVVKVLKEGLSQDASFVERFRREARAVAALSHPNIASVYDSGEDAGRHFMVMELVKGRDLGRIINEDGALSPDRAADIAAQMCDALAHAHAADIIHRDVKPANVIVDEGTGQALVTDFGIARAAGDSTLTGTGLVLGTG
ncbi:MAG: protein kinase domain-containing protein [Actinomycetota bacterium]